MAALIYTNKYKDPDNVYTEKLLSRLRENGIGAKCVTAFDERTEKGDVLFVVGGDGTILDVKDYALERNLPIIGINAGKLGFLTEFEREETESAADGFARNVLIKDERICCALKVGETLFNALNEITVQRISCGNGKNGIVTDLTVYVDGDKLERLIGDGVIISTPTGSTAYSLASGGAVLTPDVKAFSIVPICAHSIFAKPIIYSSDCVVKIENTGKTDAGIFVDGDYVGTLRSNESIVVQKSNKTLTFLRKRNYNFLNRLVKKLGDRF